MGWVLIGNRQINTDNIFNFAWVKGELLIVAISDCLIRIVDPYGEKYRELCEAISVKDKPMGRERWIWNEGGWWECSGCSCCPAPWEAKPDNEYSLPPFCHSCGARMDLPDTNVGCKTDGKE